MANEIERKFLVEKMPELAPGIKSEIIKQKYMRRAGSTSGPDIYVKQLKENAVLTIKSENEYKYEIPLKDAVELSKIFEISAPTVRIRQLGNEGFITIKGDKVGMTQPEFEYGISIHDAQELFELCEPGSIEKIRYYIPHGNHVIELDVFSGDNQGLIVAEIELESEDDVVDIPSWFGKEVTTDNNYSNAALSKPKF